MKATLTHRLLQHLVKKKQDGGFTLIELLVVIIIIGILAAIALPSFLNQANRARQSEAKTYIGSMNRAQQAFYLENGSFSADLGALGLGIASQTQFYNYDIDRPDPAPGVPPLVTNQAQPRNNNGPSPVKAYLGGVAVGTVNTTTGTTNSTESTTIAGVCEARLAPVSDGPDGTEEVTLGGVATTPPGQFIQCPDGYVGSGGARDGGE